MSRYRNLKSVTGIVIHCSAAPNGRADTIADIDRLHGQRKPQFTRIKDARVGDGPWIGKGQHAIDLQHIGYHFFIRTNGAVEVGRRLTETGAHTQNYNNRSIGICLAGSDKFSVDQWVSLKSLVQGLLRNWQTGFKRTLEVHGYHELYQPSTSEPVELKDGPGFDVPAWLEHNMQPLADHTLADHTL